MALLPLKDDNPLKRIPFQFGTVTFMAVCIAAFFWQLSLGDARDGRYTPTARFRRCCSASRIWRRIWRSFRPR